MVDVRLYLLLLLFVSALQARPVGLHNKNNDSAIFDDPDPPESKGDDTSGPIGHIDRGSKERPNAPPGIFGSSQFTLHAMRMRREDNTVVTGGYGDSCTEYEDCQKTRRAYCDDKKCKCPSDKLPINEYSECVDAPDLHSGNCTEEMPCSRVAKGICSSGTCMCTPGYKEDSKINCIPRVHGDPCPLLDNTCPYDNGSCNNKTKLCQCEPGYVDDDNTDPKTCRARGYGEECDAVSKTCAADGTVCKEDTISKCGCEPSFLPGTPKEACVPKKLNDTCIADRDCKFVDLGKCKQVGDSVGFCDCDEFSYVQPELKTCTARLLRIGSECRETAHCKNVEAGVCLLDPTTSLLKCGCPKEFRMESPSRCIIHTELETSTTIPTTDVADMKGKKDGEKKDGETTMHGDSETDDSKDNSLLTWCLVGGCVALAACVAVIVTVLCLRKKKKKLWIDKTYETERRLINNKYRLEKLKNIIEGKELPVKRKKKDAKSGGVSASTEANTEQKRSTAGADKTAESSAVASETGAKPKDAKISMETSELDTISEDCGLEGYPCQTIDPAKIAILKKRQEMAVVELKLREELGTLLASVLNMEEIVAGISKSFGKFYKDLYEEERTKAAELDVKLESVVMPKRPMSDKRRESVASYLKRIEPVQSAAKEPSKEAAKSTTKEPSKNAAKTPASTSSPASPAK